MFLGEQIGRPREYSETTAREIDEEVTKILTSAYQRAATTLSEHEDELDRVAGELLEKEVLDGEEVQALVGEESTVKAKA